MAKFPVQTRRRRHSRGFFVRNAILLAAATGLLAGCSAESGAVDEGDVGADDVAATDVGLDDAVEADAEGDDSDLPPSHVSQAVVDAVETPDFEPWHGRLWNITPEGELPDSWIFETPPADTWGGSAADLEVVESCDEGESDCDADFGLVECSSDEDCRHGGTCQPIAATITEPGESARSLCAGHSHHTYEVLYDAIVDAEKLLDITSLHPPDGPFLAAVRNGIAFLANADRTVDVRLLFGSVMFAGFDIDEAIEDLTRDLSPSSDVTVAVGAYRNGFDSWNHTKIFAVDGQSAIVGGMNMITSSYLRDAPVFDLSMEMIGPAAADAHLFADQMWNFTCGAQFVGELGNIEYRTVPDDSDCPAELAADIERPAAGGDVWIASLGRLGDIGPNVADSAIIRALEAADDSIKLSVQDLGPLQLGPLESYAWPTSLLDVFARAITDGVDVEILMTTPVVENGGGSGDEAAYSNGWSKRDTIDRIEERLQLSPMWLPDAMTARDVICEHLSVASLRPYEEETWPGGTVYANHAKSFFVDDRAFYIGSQNLYPADLAEFGYLIDDRDAAKTLLDNYWDPLWDSSKPTVDDGCQ